MRSARNTDTIKIENLRESLKMKMEKVAESLGITLEEACNRAFVSFCKEG